MILDTPMRLLVAYGLIAVLLLAAAALAFWSARNTRERRDARARARLTERYRIRDEAAAEQASPER